METTNQEIVSGEHGQSRQLTRDGSGDAQKDFLSLIERLATNPAVDVTKLTSILDLQERVMSRNAEAEFNRAFHEMEPLIPRIKKDGSVEYKGAKAFKFATWKAVDDVIRPILRSYGFSLSFQSAPRTADGGGLVVTGTLLHVGGHSRSASIPLALDASGGKNSIQGAGSTFSYGARYTTRMLLNIVTEDEDDDGNRGGTRFVTQPEADELREMCRAAGRQEGPFLARVFAGSDIRSFEEIEQGAAYLAAKNTLAGLAKAANKGGE